MVETAELVAALLRVALATAAQAAGSPAVVVRVVTAGSWGPRRRAALRSGLQRVGAGDAELVAAPVAVGWHLLAGGAELSEEAFVVCDLGAGFTATVLSRTGDGFDVLASVEAVDGGGDALDAAVTEFLAPSGGAAELLLPARLAKEALSVTQTVLVPGPSGEQIVFGLPQLRQAAAGVVDAAVAAAVQAVEAADVGREHLGPLVCVGGGARLPVVADAFGDAVGVRPVTVPQPEVAAVLGAVQLPVPAADTTVALIWVQRRRQYLPRTPCGAHRDDPDLTPLPVPSDVDGRVVVGVTAAGWLDLADLPGGGVHLTGAGAVRALRGLVVSVLAAAATASARGPAVVISSSDLRTLVGGAVTAVPGLHVVDNQSSAATVGAVLAAAGQPVLLVRGGNGRFDGPTRAGMTVVSLAAAASLPSWQVRADGTVAAADVRLAVLNAAAAAVVLTGLRQVTPKAAAVPAQEPAAPPAAPRLLSVGVLGPVRVECADGDAVSPVHVRRTAGMHLLVLLAVHRDGATGDDLAAALWSDLPTRPTRRFATTLSELRQELQQATGVDVVERSNVLTGGSRYRLEPSAVDIDLWRFHDLLDNATSAASPAERRALLQQAADLDRGELAEGWTAAWLAPAREATARHRIDILTYLAGTEPDHGTALPLLHQALRVAPDNEAILRAVLRRHAAAGDLEGVHRAYTALLDRRSADEATPETATQQLYEELTTTDPGVPATSGAPERTSR